MKTKCKSHTQQTNISFFGWSGVPISGGEWILTGVTEVEGRRVHTELQLHGLAFTEATLCFDTS